LTSEIDEPSNIRSAWNGEHGPHWKAATDSEFDSLQTTNTWSLVQLPKGKNVVGCRWVFKVKRNADGSIDRYKARLVAQGFSQQHGVDYNEVYAPVARNSAIRAVLALATALDLEVHQMDVSTAFLNGELEEEIYMRQPEGYVDRDPDLVCKLQRSLYGLKQAARCWNEVMDKYLKSIGYKQSQIDPCIYVKNVDGALVIIVLYVDDVLIAASLKKLLAREKQLLRDRFEMVDQGEVHYILRMRVQRDRGDKTMSISQPKYLEGIVKRFGMENCKPAATPMEPNARFTKLEPGEPCVEKQQYQATIGCLTYAMTSTRPDLASAVGMLSQYMSNPGEQHWVGVKRVLRYLKGTLSYGLRFHGSSSQLSFCGYSDANWGGDPDDRLSTSGYAFMLAGACISWSSKKQRSVATSSTEAEYVALSLASQECVWLRNLLLDIGFEQSNATVLYEDNQGAIELARNPKHRGRSKHIDIRYHFVRELLQRNVISVVYCPTNEMLADVMTKPVPKPTFVRMRESLGVVDI
jgi:hypothetical protein